MTANKEGAKQPMRELPQGADIQKLKSKIKRRFFKDPTTGCWVTKTKSKSSRLKYPRTTVCGMHVAGHRLSYMLFVGPIPEGMSMCHRCDNPRCVNPDHLFPGNNSDNMKDAYNKGRLVVPNVPRKFTQDKINAIKASGLHNTKVG